MDLFSVLLFWRRKDRSILKPGLIAASLVGLFAIAAPTAAIPGETRAPSLVATPVTKTNRGKIEAMLTAELQRVVNGQKRIEGQGKYLMVKAILDPSTDTLVIDLSKEFIPRGAQYLGAEMEDLQTELYNVATELLRDIIQLKGVTFLYGGKDMYYYFPDERRFIPPARKSSSTASVIPRVVVSAGHGIYYNYSSKFRDQPWRAQRDPSNGITEDFITPGYADELFTWLSARSPTVTTNFPRSVATTTHAPSGQPWWKMSSRYHLEATYTQNPEIWHSLPNERLSSLRERDEDIRSRPLFANHVGANALLHLHTNAAGVTATGTRAIYHTGRTSAQLLGNSILCYMKELLHAQELYKNYTVPTQSEPRNDLGENTLATMPSVIVEIGFHTNPSDATALQDPVFRTAAMKGVEKGYRLNAEGKPCETFKISNIPDATGPQGEPIPHQVHYQGYPQFTVKAKVEYVACQSGWTCTNFERTFTSNTPSPLSYSTICTVSSRPSATFRVRTTLSDADGVTTAPVEHSYTCTTPAARMAPVVVSTDKPSTGIAPD
jgi:N-acetylmuramoyl-L-alanine amidase